MGNRGTSKDKPKKQDTWTGEKFKKEEEKRLAKSGVEFITSGRGTGKISVKKSKTSNKKKYSGRISTGRGTGSRDQ